MNFWEKILTLSNRGNGNIIASSVLDKIVIYFEYVELAVQGVFGKKIDQQNLQILLSRLNQFKIVEKNGNSSIIIRF